VSAWELASEWPLTAGWLAGWLAAGWLGLRAVWCGVAIGSQQSVVDGVRGCGSNAVATTTTPQRQTTTPQRQTMTTDDDDDDDDEAL